MKSFAFASLILANTGYAQVPDKLNVTNDFLLYLDTHWVGSASAADNEWDNTFCAVPRPGGGCIEKGGTKIYGKAKGSVKYLESKVGQGWIIKMNEDPFTGIQVPDHWTDLTLTWYYDGESQGTKQCYPGNYFCGYEWESLHPTGRIVATFQGDGSHFYIRMSYQVIQGHGDKPNKVLYLAMQNLSSRLQQVVTDFIHLKGSSADVVIIPPKA